MAWLLTGGAGYIGSHIALAFREAGTDVVVLDDLSTGYRGYVPDDVDFVDGSVEDPDAVARALDQREIAGIVHLAGLKYAGVSVEQPLEFFRANVTGTQVLLEAVAGRGIPNFLFSSSASWYGTPGRRSSTRTPSRGPRARTARARSSASGCCATWPRSTPR